MNYQSYIPQKLAGIVDMIWEQEVPYPGKFTLLPSGKVELIFPVYRGCEVSAFKIPSQANPVQNFPCFLSGLHTKPLEMTFDRFHVFGIQMKPVSVKALFGIPLSEIRDYFIEGSLIFKTICVMQEKVYSTISFEEKATWFERFLLSKLNETAELHEAINLSKAITQIIQKHHVSTSRKIQDKMGYSRTHTYRLFNDWFGVSAHSHQKLSQFIHSVEALHGPSNSLTDIGLKNGFFDQSHFIRCFREFANMTPGQYRKRMNGVPGQIIEPLDLR